MERGDALVDLGQPDGVCIEHRAAAIRRKAVTGEIDDIDVGSTGGNAFFEDPCAFVDERIDTTLEDLLLALRATRDSGRRRRALDNSRHVWIGYRLPVTGLVAIPPLSGLLAETVHGNQGVGDQRLA